MAVNIERVKEFIVNEMNGTDMKLVIQKILYKSDTSKSLNRLNMPINQLENDDFLTADEKLMLNNQTERVIDVLVLGPTLKVYEKPMKLKMWRMASSANYVLTTSWYMFWMENKQYLEEGSKVQIWSFRKDGVLCFAVVACVP